MGKTRGRSRVKRKNRAVKEFKERLENKETIRDLRQAKTGVRKF
jgi:hypothetical protein